MSDDIFKINDDIFNKYKGKNIISCPCGEIYTMKEYGNLKSVGNIEDLYDARECSKCGSIFSSMRMIGVNKETDRVQVYMNVDLIKKKNEINDSKIKIKKRNKRGKI